MTPTPKVAFLIDGGFLLKRLPYLDVGQSSLRPSTTLNDDISKFVAKANLALNLLTNNHLTQLNKTYRIENQNAMIYRIFYYDAEPFDGQQELPISNKNINYKITQQSKMRQSLFESIRTKPNYALRLGHVASDSKWHLTDKAVKKIIKKEINIDSLTDDDFYLGLRQKGVDMRIGLDIASLAFKQQANIIVLVTGDSDFIPAAKLARREGINVILDSLGQSIKNDFAEHVDGRFWGLTPERKK